MLILPITKVFSWYVVLSCYVRAAKAEERLNIAVWQ